jgi:hypothetical protein
MFIGVFKPILVLALLMAGTGLLFLYAALTARRPIEEQSAVLPDEWLAKGLDRLAKGSGNIYLRFICLGSAIIWFVLAGFAIFTSFE